MAKQKDLSVPKLGMNRSLSPHLLKEGEYSFQLNGNSYDEGGDKFNLTDEHSNILAVKFDEGFKFIGGKNHVVRNKTYIFLANPVSGVSEIGCIINNTNFESLKDLEVASDCTDCPDYYNSEASNLENSIQSEHQKYETLLEDSCNLCLGFNINNPIIDIIIKEQNIGTKLFWTSTPGNKEFRYLELDDIDKYKLTGDDNCGQIPSETCLDCDKLRVFPLYSELKVKNYSRTVGGSLKKGSYEILAAYSDQLGNEFTSYVPLTSIVPIFDEANIIHEQLDNNAETNFSIKVELDNVDINFDYYKVAVRYYTSKGVFTSFIEGIHGTSDKSIIVSDNNGQSINNNKIALVKPFVETVDGATASNNILVLNGIKEREPVNLQPVINLAGLGVQWMSYRAKENLYSSADSYKYIGYNRDENVALAIDFGMKDGYRTNPYVFIPRPATSDELSVFNSGDDYDSVTSASSICDDITRDKKWQFYNTAVDLGPCPLTENIPVVVQTENITTYTIVPPFDSVNEPNGIPFVPANQLVINLDEVSQFVDLKTFIEDNKVDNVAAIGVISSYIDSANLLTYNKEPVSPSSSCQPFVLDPEQVINIDSIENEQLVYTYPNNTDNYSPIPEPDLTTIYSFKGSGSEIDWDFSFAYSSGIEISSNINPFHFVSYVRKRQQVYVNTRCTKSDDLRRITDGNVSNVSRYYHHNNKGSIQLTDLQDTSIDMSSTTQGSLTDKDGIFTQYFHNNALWFKTKVYDRDKFYINLSENSRCNRETITMNGYGYNYGTNKTTLVRVSIFDTCNDTQPLWSDIVDLRLSSFITVDSSIINSLTTTSLFVSVESSIKQSTGLGPDWELNDWIEWRENTSTSGGSIAYNQFLQNGAEDFSEFVTTYVSNLPCGAWKIVDRDEEPSEISISWDKINISKTQKYTTSCDFEIPVLQDCEPVPYKYGELGYYESTDTYPDNEELYDSSSLIINKDKITNSDLLTKLDTYKQTENPTQIFLSDKADFRCKNIRHYKLPDNKISPFIGSSITASNSDSIISPLGFTIDGEVIQNMLDVAVDNNLITQDQRDNIIDYKIYRSDSTLDRSVVSSGLAYNTKSYSVGGETISYFNYPFNSLGKDKYYPENTDDDFDKMQVISPEFDYFKPSLPSEMSLQGFMFGKSNSRILPVEDHSKMVILGGKARSLARTLATLEVVAESALNLASTAESWRFDAGFVFSANPVGIGLHIVLAGIEIFSGVVYRYGKYKLEWEKAFEDLGAPYNFGYYSSSASNYNYIKTLQTDGDRLRGLSVKKYLKSGMLNVSDTVSGNIIKINNIDREEGTFFGLGDYPLENLDSEYISFDNSDITPNFSSQVLSSEIGCHGGRSPEQLRNTASPYIAFKNFISNQYGTIGSIKWIDTTYCFPIEEKGVCKGFLGGDTFISRHSKKRKARLFETDLLGSADLTPFPYKFNANYGNPKYYIDYKINSEFTSGGRTFPETFYDVSFDCNTSSNSFYVEPPGKFYLYNISFVNFLCETRINTNFRNARKEPWDQFYPQNTDYEAITQPKIVSLTRPENFYYNKAYLQTSILNSVFTLPDYYSKEDEAKKSYNINSGIYSLPDVNENSITEPWLLYRPNDKFTLDSKYGNLVNMKGIESDQILMYFEDALQLQNSVNKFTDGSTNYNSDLGNGGIFAKRALTLRTTDIGYGGSQSKQTLSCEFGHFHADTKRGQIFKYSGSNLEEVSRYSNGKPNGMDVWFKEHLPFKITKKFPNYEATDNPYNGVGIHWGYDSKYRRILLTKKDYVPKNNIVRCEDKFYNSNIEDYQVEIQNRISQGYSFDGIEDCQLKFSKQGIDSNTDIYAIFDTTSMQVTDGQAASNALNSWYSNFQTINPNFTGNLYIIPYGNEAYVDFPRVIKNGNISASTFGGWSSIAVLPPNLNTSNWTPPSDLLLLSFVDESNSEYHGSTVSGGFSSSGIVQPTTSYLSNYQTMIAAVSSYNSFKGVVYPIVQSLTGTGGALVLQVLAAMKGTTLTSSEISDTNTAVNVSQLLTSNPYENATIPGSNPPQVIQPLENFNWVAQYDKTSPASAVFTSQQFQTDLDNLISSDQSTVYEPLTEVFITDTNYFKDVSWTITYKPETGSWESYMSYTPNYYINHTDYFQSGINSNDEKQGLWSHLLSNKSYRVFYGQKFPYIVEYPVKNQYISKRLEDISWNAQLRRHHNDYDFATIEENPFSAVTIFNNYENSGRLVPVKNNGSISQLSKYPITNSDNSQDILVSYDNYRYNLNYFYNRVNSNKNNQPIWLWDENQIEKTINSKAVSFYGKSILERLKGNFFTIRLERNGNTNYDLDFRWSEQTVNTIR